MDQLSRRERKRIEGEQKRLEEEKKQVVEVEERLKRSKGRTYIWIGVILVLVAVFAIWGITSYAGPGKYDEFAKCLSEKGVKEYGAYWCPNCQTQKNMFGKSFKGVEYVECSPNGKGSPQAEVCNLAGVSGYPTWINNEGRQLVGVQQMNRLAEFSGCGLES